MAKVCKTPTGGTPPAGPDQRPTKPQRKRRVTYSEKLVDVICERIAAGEMWSTFAGTPSMPSYSALYDWRDNYPYCTGRLAQARDRAADAAADELVEVAREATAKTASADRLRVGALQWKAGKSAPHRYGARAEAAELPARRLVIRVRHFEEVVGPDGARFIREILPEAK